MTETRGYAVAYLREVDFDEEIVEYLRRIDETLDPYGGRFLVHGGTLHPLEGEWPGDVVIVEFPSVEAAKAWYHSPGYQDILRLRTDNSHSITAILEGVPAGYRAEKGLEKMLAAR
jgi:uncharacterized protein (DUF1330 family)